MRTIPAASKVVAWLVLLGAVVTVLPIALLVFLQYALGIPDPKPASEIEQEHILRGVLRQVPMVMITPTIALCQDFSGSRERADCDGTSITSRKGNFFHPISLKLRRELVLVNRIGIKMPESKSLNVIYRPDSFLSMIFVKGSVVANWQKFYQEFPGTAGYVQVTHAVLSEDGSHALIYIVHGCGGLCGSGNLYYLVRTSSVAWPWQVELRREIWMN